MSDVNLDFVYKILPATETTVYVDPNSINMYVTEIGDPYVTEDISTYYVTEGD